MVWSYTVSRIGLRRIDIHNTQKKRKKKKNVYILFGDCREIESNTPRGVRARSINGKNRPEYKTCGATRQVEQ
jgi:hypothetical protein